MSKHPFGPIAAALAAPYMAPGQIAAACARTRDAKRAEDAFFGVGMLLKFLSRLAELSDRRQQATWGREAYAEVERREDAYWRDVDNRIDQAREDAECDRRGIDHG